MALGIGKVSGWLEVEAEWGRGYQVVEDVPFKSREL